MILPELRFDFHDSLLYGYSLGPRYEATLKIRLYEIYYKGSPLVSVRFGKIVNFQIIETYLKAIEPACDESASLARIDTLCYDVSKKSTAGKLHFHLDLDVAGVLQIRCGRLTIEVVENEI